MEKKHIDINKLTSILKESFDIEDYEMLSLFQELILFGTKNILHHLVEIERIGPENKEETVAFIEHLFEKIRQILDEIYTAYNKTLTKH